MAYKFRNLRADEIECRVSQISDKGLSLLLYKDARCDQNILDETVGAMNWQKHYDLIDGQLFCTIQIWDPDKEMWISKQDVGTESNTEAEKGRASDAQKRAAFCFGIGRELYTAPFIWIPANKCQITTGKNGKPACYDRFRVKSMKVKDGTIVSLQIATKNGVVFSYGSVTESNEAKQETSVENVNSSLIRDIDVVVIKKAIAQKGLAPNSILQHYKRTSFEEMTFAEFKNAMDIIEKYPDKEKK